MKSLCAVLVAASLLSSSAFAAPPLAPGKPAGLTKAQDMDGLVAAGIAVAVSGNSNNNVATGSVPGGGTTTTTTTTTT